ncbi:MAG: PIN domain-containing protein [Patescibacteria group bacterium]
MTKKIISKIVFIDTNIFINCALAETRDLNRVADINTLKDIKEKLDNKEMIIILPENIKAEIITGMKIGFKKLEKYINDSFSKVNSYEKENKGKISMLIKEEIEKSKKDLIDKIIKKSKTISKIINEIIEHKNIKFVKLSNELILLGIKRSLLMKGPYTLRSSENKNQKNAYSRDQDCIAFESFLNYLNKNKKELKKSECIICSDDSDYFKDSKKNALHNNIIQEIKCKKLSGYKDILDMLEKEFGNKYSEKQIEEHKSSLDETTQFLNAFSIDINKNPQRLYIDEDILGRVYASSLEDTMKNLTKHNMYSALDNKLPSASDLLGKGANQYIDIENLTLNPNRNELGLDKNSALNHDAIFRTNKCPDDKK